jgi:hypothetical protein
MAGNIPLGVWSQVPQFHRLMREGLRQERGVASGRTGAEVGSLKTLRGRVAIQGKVQGQGAWTQRAGSIGGGVGESSR